MMKKILLWKLRIITKLILKKYQPKIIGVTGSVGKTSARYAIYAVLSAKFKVNKVVKNYNNEIGLPLTVIGVDSPGNCYFGWFLVFCHAFWLLLKKNKNYPEVLILEYGIDRKNDMDYLLEIAKPDISLITRIAESHAEFFGSLLDIKKEKAKIFDKTKENAKVIINQDDENIKNIKIRKDLKSISFAFFNKADFQGQKIKLNYLNAKNANNLLGMQYTVKYEKNDFLVSLPQVIGNQAVYASLAALAVGRAMGLELGEMINSLKNLKMPSGRMNIIKGNKGTVIIDDTYNSSSPTSTFVALDFVSRIKPEKPARKIAVLGSMLELGQYSVESHREVGKSLKKVGIEQLIIVGERSRDIGRGALENGFKEDQIFYFADSETAGKFLENKMKKGDLIFVKGSQGARMEKIVKEIMAEPLRATELLVRQEDTWLKE